MYTIQYIRVMWHYQAIPFAKLHHIMHDVIGTVPVGQAIFPSPMRLLLCFLEMAVNQ